MVGIEHDSEGGSHGLRRQVSSELGSNCTSVSVRLCDSAPNSSEPGVVSHSLRLVDVSHSLAHVVASVFLLINSFDSK